MSRLRNVSDIYILTMKSLVFLIFFVSILYAKFVDLTEETFYNFVKDNAAIIEFYSPGCKNCQEFAPIYEKAMKLVEEKNLPYAVARVDITENKKLADKYSVGKLPILQFFYKGQNLPYYGATDSQYLMEFIEQLYKSVEPSIEIKSEEELKKRGAVKSAAAILIGGSEEELEIFQKLPQKFNSMWFFHTSTELGKKVFKEVKTVPCIILIKEANEDRSIYTETIQEQAIETFINIYKRPKINKLDQEVINSLFKNTGKKGIILLREENEEGKKAELVLTQLADKHRSEDLLFVVTDIESELGKRVGKMLGVGKDKLPHMEIVETKKKLERVKYEGGFVLEEMNKFIEEWKASNKQKTDL